MDICSCKSWDLTGLLSYNTPRYVRIRDWRLGVLQIGLNTMVLGYFLFAVFGEGSYRSDYPVSGEARLSLLAPPSSWLNTLDPNLPYCVDANTSAPWGGGTYSGKGGAKGSKLECRYYDAMDSIAPFLEPNAVFVSSRVSESVETVSDASCYEFRHPSCEYELQLNRSYYPVGVEFYSVRIDHAVSVPSLDIFRSAKDMTGELLDQNGEAMDPCVGYKNNKGYCSQQNIVVGELDTTDTIPLQTLLEAAGVTSLDLAGEEKDETIRYAGLILQVGISYSNYDTVNTSLIRYRLSVETVPREEFKGVQVLYPGNVPANYNSHVPSRWLNNRHGIRIAVTQVGRIGVFQFSALLTSIVSTVALLFVTNFIVHTIAMYIMPLQVIYRRYETVTSVDFATLPQIDDRTLTRLKTEDLINPRTQLEAELSNSDKGGVTVGSGLGSTPSTPAPPTNSASTFFGITRNKRVSGAVVTSSSGTRQDSSTLNPVADAKIRSDDEEDGLHIAGLP